MGTLDKVKKTQTCRSEQGRDGAQCSHRSAPRGMPSRKGAVTQQKTQAKASQSVGSHDKYQKADSDSLISSGPQKTPAAASEGAPNETRPRRPTSRASLA